MATKRTQPKVPSSFYLVGCQWTVKYIEDLSDYGTCDSSIQTIRLRADMNKNFTEQTFCHELVHAIMFSMGHANHDEIFVDAFGALLHQYGRTAV